MSIEMQHSSLQQPLDRLTEHVLNFSTHTAPTEDTSRLPHKSPLVDRHCIEHDQFQREFNLLRWDLDGLTLSTSVVGHSNAEGRRIVEAEESTTVRTGRMCPLQCFVDRTANLVSHPGGTPH